jgi:cytochrome c oxidase subunit III
MSETITNSPIKIRSVNPQRFALWLFIVSITMIFASMTSAYVVKKADGNWLLITFPELFKITSVIIVISSITMHVAYLAAKNNQIKTLKVALLSTLVLAVGFVIGQYQSWGELVAQDIYFVGNPAGSFIYVFTGLHVLHLVGGILFLAIVIFRAFKYRVHSKNLLSIELCTTYWHFLGGLWLYLYLFLIINN